MTATTTAFAPASYGETREHIELFTADLHFGDPRAVLSRRYGSGEAATAAYDRDIVYGLALAVCRAAQKHPGVPVRLHVVGDLSSGRTHDDALHALAMMGRVREIVEQELPGTELVLVLYPGNHDSCSQIQPWGLDRRTLFLRQPGVSPARPSRGKHAAPARHQEGSGHPGQFDLVTDHAIMRMQLSDGTHQDVLIAHLPYWRLGDGRERFEKNSREPRLEQWRLPDLGLPLIHGHTHSPDRHVVHGEPGQEETDLTMLCVSHDAWAGQYGVATQEDISEWLVAWKHTFPPLPGQGKSGARVVPERIKYDWRREVPLSLTKGE